MESQRVKKQVLTAPLLPLMKTWLQLSVKARAVPLELIAAQPLWATSSDERRSSLLTTIFEWQLLWESLLCDIAWLLTARNRHWL
jgi:hypothetical protein